MFNSSLKKEWLGQLDVAKQEYEYVFNEAQQYITSLYETRTQAVLIIDKVEELVNSIAKSPKQLEKEIGEIKAELKFFREIVNLQYENESSINTSGSMASIGAAGLGVAAFGPTTAMAIATTFGTASTGAAISSLSGAAAVNAATAWLGGGALAAGGGGMASGGALLATLGGPVTWTIGGVALAGSFLLRSSKNKKIAKEAEQLVYKIHEDINNVKKIQAEVIGLDRLTSEHFRSLNEELGSVVKLITGNDPLLIGYQKRVINHTFRIKTSVFLILTTLILLFICKYNGAGEKAISLLEYICGFASIVLLPVGLFRWIKAKFQHKQDYDYESIASDANDVKKVNFDNLSEKKQDALFTLVNNTHSLSKLVSKKVG